VSRALPVLALLAGCAIAPPPPSPDPLAGGDRQGGLVAAGPSEAGFCVSQEVPPSLVLLIPEGVAVRPVDGTPDYALLPRQAEAGTAWSRQVVAAEPAVAAAAMAERLDQALAGCAPLLGGNP